MDDRSSRTLQFQMRIDRLRAGDTSARDELLTLACERLGRLARKMLKGYPRVRRWEETGDVLQNATLRLGRALDEVAPATTADFFRLAALQIRRELIDLARHYYGPQGEGANHATAGASPRPAGDDTEPAYEPAAKTDDPSRLASWAEFHRQVEVLPTEEREAFDLLWYQGLSQAEASELLGVSERTVKRRWQAARSSLYRAMDGELPGA
jgi:RNA polymerase sigma factor (sigma-70 family)